MKSNIYRILVTATEPAADRSVVLRRANAQQIETGTSSVACHISNLASKTTRKPKWWL
jgi:hypothetical protein